MPRVVRVVLPVGDLSQAQRFYAALLGDEGMALAPGWHSFSFAGALLTCHQAPPGPRGGEPLYVSVDEAIHQVHYRAGALGGTLLDPQPCQQPTGETGFRMLDPWGNPLCVVDERSVQFQAQRSSAAVAPPAPMANDGTMTLQRDFINFVKGGNVQAVSDLLEIEPELVDTADAAGVSALLHAAYKGQQAVADLLLSRYQDLNLWEAAAFGKPERIAALLDRGFKPNVYAPDGFTPLGLACFFGHPACVTLLLQRGADPNLAATNDMQVRPLHSAVARASESAALVNARALLTAGADVNATQQGGYTPLHQAADRGLEALARFLLGAGANPAARAGGRAPIDLARARGHVALVTLLTR